MSGQSSPIISPYPNFPRNVKFLQFHLQILKQNFITNQNVFKNVLLHWSDIIFRQHFIPSYQLLRFKFEICKMNFKSMADFCAAIGICTVASIQIVIYYRRRFSISMQSMQLALLMILSFLADRIDPRLSLAFLFVGGLIMWRQILKEFCVFDLEEIAKFLICWVMLLSMKMQLLYISEYSNEFAFVM